MYKKNKILALIPARGGSKRLPNKNIRILSGKPLIAWTIGQAKASQYIDDIIVSTDDQKIALIAERCGARAPFLRPARIARDNTPTLEVVLHLLSYLKSVDNVFFDFIVLLQPTSPLRRPQDIDNALKMLVSDKKADAVLGMVEVAKNPHRIKVIKPKGYVSGLVSRGRKFSKRLEASPVYKLNGAIYVYRIKALLKNKTLLPKKSLGYIMPQELSIDIDDIADFKAAELLVKQQER